jgi:hypothetical protein
LSGGELVVEAFFVDGCGVVSGKIGGQEWKISDGMASGVVRTPNDGAGKLAPGENSDLWR